MPSEYIMYMSILLVGVLAIGGISVTMVSINNSMENRAIETNMENILQKIAEIIYDLKANGESQIQQGMTEVEIIVPITIPGELYEEEYVIEATATNTTYSLKASLQQREEVTVSVSLLINPGTITIAGTIDSTALSPYVMFTYDGVSASIILSS